MGEAQAFIARLPRDGTHFTLTDVRETRYDRDILEAFERLTVHDRPYVRALGERAVRGGGRGRRAACIGVGA